MSGSQTGRQRDHCRGAQLAADPKLREVSFSIRFDDGETVDIAVVLDRELGEVDSGDFAADVGVSKADSNAVPEAREAVSRTVHALAERQNVELAESFDSRLEEALHQAFGLAGRSESQDVKDRRRFERLLDLPNLDEVVAVLEAFLSAASSRGLLSWDELGTLWGVNAFPSDGKRPIRVNVGQREALDVQADGTVGWYLVGSEPPMISVGADPVTQKAGLGDNPINIRLETSLNGAAELVRDPDVASRFAAWFDSCLGRNLQRPWHNVAVERWLSERHGEKARGAGR